MRSRWQPRQDAQDAVKLEVRRVPHLPRTGLTKPGQCLPVIVSCDYTLLSDLKCLFKTVCISACLIIRSRSLQPGLYHRFRQLCQICVDSPLSIPLSQFLARIRQQLQIMRKKNRVRHVSYESLAGWKFVFHQD